MPKRTGLTNHVRSVLAKYYRNGSEFTVDSMLIHIRDLRPQIEYKQVGSIFTHLSNTQEIICIRRDGGKKVYKLHASEKGKSFDSQAKTEESTFSAVEVGEAVIKLIEDLKKKNVDLTEELADIKRQLDETMLENVDLLARSNKLSTEIGQLKGSVTLSKKELHLGGAHAL